MSSKKVPFDLKLDRLPQGDHGISRRFEVYPEDISLDTIGTEYPEIGTNSVIRLVWMNFSNGVVSVMFTYTSGENRQMLRRADIPVGGCSVADLETLRGMWKEMDKRESDNDTDLTAEYYGEDPDAF